MKEAAAETTMIVSWALTGSGQRISSFELLDSMFAVNKMWDSSNGTVCSEISLAARFS